MQLTSPRFCTGSQVVVERIQITDLVDIDPPESVLLKGLNIQATAAVIVTWGHLGPLFQGKRWQPSTFWVAMESLQYHRTSIIIHRTSIIIHRTSIIIHQHHHPSTSQLGQEMTKNMFGERMSLATCCPEIEMQIWDHHGNACKGPGFLSSFVPLACLNQDPSCSQVRAQLSKDCWPLHAGRPGLHLHLVHTSSMTKEELLLQEEVVEIGPSAWVLPSRSICKTHSKAMARFWTIDEVRGGTQLIFV